MNPIFLVSATESDGDFLRKLPNDQFVYETTEEALRLYCAEKAGIPTKFFPLFALYSLDLKLWLPPDCCIVELGNETVGREMRLVH